MNKDINVQFHSNSTQENTGNEVVIDIESVLFLIAMAMFVINIIPTLPVGFLQDDFKLIDNTQDWGWNLWLAIRQDGYGLGFRPLNLLQHAVFWNLLGESPLLHRLLRILVHFTFGWLLVYSTRLLGGSRLHAAVVLLLYFSATTTNPTIYYWIMFTPSDILSLGALVVMLVGVKKGWSAIKLSLATGIVAALAVFTKESGIAASGGVLLLAIVFWKSFSKAHRIGLFVSHFVLLLVYGRLYQIFSANKWMTVSEFSPEIFQKQALDVLKGVIISVSAPFSAIYLSLRGTGLDVIFAIAITFMVMLGVTCFLWIAHGQQVQEVFKALRPNLGLGLIITLLIIGFLVPYLPGRWFATRMLVVTFAMGTLFWGMILGNALQAWLNAPSLNSRNRTVWGVAIVVILAAMAAGTPLPSEEIMTEERTIGRLREVVREAQEQGIDICLVEFHSKGEFLRVGNALGVVGYESKRQVSIHTYDSITDIPQTLNCVIVNYDEALINQIPLAIEWPASFEQRSLAPQD